MKKEQLLLLPASFIIGLCFLFCFCTQSKKYYIINNQNTSYSRYNHQKLLCTNSIKTHETKLPDTQGEIKRNTTVIGDPSTSLSVLSRLDFLKKNNNSYIFHCNLTKSYWGWEKRLKCIDSSFSPNSISRAIWGCSVTLLVSTFPESHSSWIVYSSWKSEP